jgi:energy-coupling factor transporter ATP-binding protein EcfA2
LNNLNVLILGQTGSGKTSLAKHLLALTPRAFVFDPRDDYAHVAPFYGFRPAVDFYLEHHARDFHLVYRGEPETYVAWLDILFRAQRQYTDPPLGIFLEESSLYSSSHKIDTFLERAYTQGRRQRINIVTVVQRDTQIHPIIRANSHVWISLRQRKFSSDVKELYTADELDRISRLKTYMPGIGPPIEGTHYIPDQPDFPLVETWTKLVRDGT